MAIPRRRGRGPQSRGGGSSGGHAPDEQTRMLYVEIPLEVLLVGRLCHAPLCLLAPAAQLLHREHAKLHLVGAQRQVQPQRRHLRVQRRRLRQVDECQCAVSLRHLNLCGPDQRPSLRRRIPLLRSGSELDEPPAKEVLLEPQPRVSAGRRGGVQPHSLQLCEAGGRQRRVCSRLVANIPERVEHLGWRAAEAGLDQRRVG
mmetsp:Transcript_10771/g.35730  ORF Transcript_10771/g.35730 Transcript_10771/m.35730 type:complete len:201 (-) Transcript_10771:455-1057(-)